MIQGYDGDDHQDEAARLELVKAGHTDVSAASECFILPRTWFGVSRVCRVETGSFFTGQQLGRDGRRRRRLGRERLQTTIVLVARRGF